MTMTMAMSAFLSAVMFLLLRSAMPSCVPTEYTLYVEKPGCDYCVAINTTICTGFCFSRDSNVKELVGPRFVLQTGCAYQELEYRTAQLPGCGPQEDPLFTYPVALSCHCGTCRPHSDECSTHHGHSGGRWGGSQCSKPLWPFYLEPSYPQQDNYIQYD
ncbi:thyroid stimulating hormone subunit beta a [Engraulis encrasicolus]|uniref:thyroid stimulating hormone subunit beta a n=1 Tax=Engraulis encrasicolus TaxID=184585 RepID=UPI002FCFD370